MKAQILALLALVASCGFASCSDTIDTAQERRATNERNFLSFADSAGYEKVHLPGNYADSYVYIKWQKHGTGTVTPAQNDAVKVRYRGYLTSDWTSNSRSAQPVDQGNWDQPVINDYSRVNSYIDGFKYALQSLKVGDEVSVVIPWYLGYGSSITRYIPSYSSLFFQIKLEEISTPL